MKSSIVRFALCASCIAWLRSSRTIVGQLAYLWLIGIMVGHIVAYLIANVVLRRYHEYLGTIGRVFKHFATYVADSSDGLCGIWSDLGLPNPLSVYRWVVGPIISLNRYLWSYTDAGRYTAIVAAEGVDMTKSCHLQKRFGKASWDILTDVSTICRAQLGLDRLADPRDPATRELVARTCYGMLTDTKRYPDLRIVEASRLALVARELALTPIGEELDALVMGSSDPFVRNRTLASMSWGWRPTTWFRWGLAKLGIGAGPQYLRAVPVSSF